MSVRRAPRAIRRAIGAVRVAVLVQFSLGIATLALFVPMHLAAAHQMGAVVVLLTTLRAAHLTRATDAERERDPTEGDEARARPLSSRDRSDSREAPSSSRARTPSAQ